jgi:protein-S-isoprenylcysteine O-methyltransferase Ste14
LNYKKWEKGEKLSKSGIILGILSTPLALGSFIALIFSGLIMILFIIRTYLEDKTLQNELPGYKEYIKEVHYRLVPGLW